MTGVTAQRIPRTKHSWGVVCARCGGRRGIWSVEEPGPYVCQRCRAALAGGNVMDPAAERSEAQQAVLQTMQERRASTRTSRSSPQQGDDRGVAPEEPR
jgi:hypothetical protein